ncbi:MAG: ComEC/Rec2 family competence protein, partial [Lachnospiraceae bacterium]|nr:ComEC/Rec2 family competence protein [Lachnospiraceae bacterium]
SNPGEFDYRAYMRSLGICGQVRQLSIRQAKLSGRHALFRTLLYRVRQRIKEALLSVAEPEDAGILLCIISGDRSGLDQETRDLYQEAGIIHLLTVSALHISILCAGLLKLVKKLTGSKQGACLIAGAAAGAFCIMAGEGTSLVRAVICFWMLLGGEWFGKAYDMPTAAATAGFWILQESPLLLFQSGFLMTFSCCLGIGLCLGLMQELFMPDISEKDDMAGISGISGLSGLSGPSVLPEPGQRYEWHARLILSVLSGLYSPGRLALSWGKRGLLAAVLLQLFTLPVLMTSNGNISLLSPISNLLTVPLMSLLLLSDMLGILGALVWRPAGIFALAPAHYILRWFDKVCSFSLHWVGGSPGGWQILIWFGFLTAVLAAGYYKLTHQHKRLPYAAGLILFPVCLLILWRLPGSRLQIRVLDVGQGDGIVMETPQGQVFCIDGGSTTEQNLAEYVYKPYLLHEGIRQIDGWLITHTDYDHYSGMLEILKSEFSRESEGRSEADHVHEYAGQYGLFHIEHVYMPFIFQDSELAREIERYTDIIYISEGDQLVLGNLSLTVLHPAADEMVRDSNDGSAAVLAEYGSFSALFTGDLPAEHEMEMLGALADYDTAEAGTITDADGGITVLKCGHHGSRTASSGSLLDAIHPQAAVISCGLNNSYGHPHQEVLDRLDERGIDYCRTDQQGCITISVSEDGEWEIQSYLDQ